MVFLALSDIDILYCSMFMLSCYLYIIYDIIYGRVFSLYETMAKAGLYGCFCP